MTPPKAWTHIIEGNAVRETSVKFLPYEEPDRNPVAMSVESAITKSIPYIEPRTDFIEQLFYRNERFYSRYLDEQAVLEFAEALKESMKDDSGLPNYIKSRIKRFASLLHENSGRYSGVNLDILSQRYSLPNNPIPRSKKKTLWAYDLAYESTYHIFTERLGDGSVWDNQLGHTLMDLLRMELFKRLPNDWDWPTDLIEEQVILPWEEMAEPPFAQDDPVFKLYKALSEVAPDDNVATWLLAIETILGRNHPIFHRLEQIFPLIRSGSISFGTNVQYGSYEGNLLNHLVRYVAKMNPKVPGHDKIDLNAIGAACHALSIIDFLPINHEETSPFFQHDNEWKSPTDRLKDPAHPLHAEFNKAFQRQQRLATRYGNFLKTQETVLRVEKVIREPESQQLAIELPTKTGVAWGFETPVAEAPENPPRITVLVTKDEAMPETPPPDPEALYARMGKLTGKFSGMAGVALGSGAYGNIDDRE